MWDLFGLIPIEKNPTNPPLRSKIRVVGRHSGGIMALLYDGQFKIIPVVFPILHETVHCAIDEKNVYVNVLPIFH